MPDLLRSPIHEVHAALGARFVPFAGFEMPVTYGSILEEHRAVRTAAGLFDVSHMGNLWLRGPRASEGLSRAFVCDAAKIPELGTKYTMALRADGTILDDLYVIRLPEAFHVVPNAGMSGEVVSHLQRHGGVPAEDATRTTCIFAIQGPRAATVLQKICEAELAGVRPFRAAHARVAGVELFLTRTGYTGEGGFELFPRAGEGRRVFEALLKAGAPEGLVPCGLGARDTLRLEKGFCLAGHEFAGGRTPLEAGLEKFVAFDHEFVGRGALLRQRDEGGYERLVGIRVAAKGIPRQDDEVTARGERVGRVTSGTMSPTLGVGIALAYVTPAASSPGTRVDVVVRGKPLEANVVPLPFL